MGIVRELSLKACSLAYITNWNYSTFQKTHRRCSSLPETQYKSFRYGRKKYINMGLSQDVEMPAFSSCSQDMNHDVVTGLSKPAGNIPKMSHQNEEPRNEKSLRVAPQKSSSNRKCIKNNSAAHTNNLFFVLEKRSHSLPSLLIAPSENLNLNRYRRSTICAPKTLILEDCDSVENSSKECSIPQSILRVNYSEIQEKSRADNLRSAKFDKSRTSRDRSLKNSGVIKKTLMNPKKSISSSAHLNKRCTFNRPNELKLYKSITTETDESCADTMSSVSEIRDSDKTDAQQVSSNSAPEYIGEWLVVGAIPGKKVTRKKTFMEDGGTSVLPMSTGYFPRPAQGQSLTSFLSSCQFSRTYAELDRENAHFSISEAMIAAIEQVKCNRQLRLAEEVREESDEEINRLKQRIRMRRRQKQEEGQKLLWSINLLSDGKTDTTTTEQSVSPLSTSPETPSESISTDDVEDLEIDEVSNLKELKNTGLSMSMASLYSEADLLKHSALTPKGTDVTLTNLSDSVVSAENVALSLLRQFKEKQLPRASDLEWLVSEEDVPQELLPMPKSWPVSPDEAEDMDMRKATPLRGTTEWAPPRPQVIFTPHPPPVRRILLAKQNNRCAGCGLKVAVEYSHRFRYCEYLGRYFCTGCHSNKLALIPGRILTKWNFTRYPVSTFSYRLLDQMSTDPLFQINDLNPSLYKKIKQLEKTRQLRLQLYYLKDFLLTCRFAERLQENIEREQSYILTDTDVYSLQDLLQVRSGELPSRLRDLVAEGCSHVISCDLCQARGFVCELCNSKDIIFPWQMGKVLRCTKCGTCFHLTCFKSGFCPRCLRIEARRKSQDVVCAES